MMSIDECKDEYGGDADTLCRVLCGLCDANDWYCPDDCESIAWIRRHYNLAIERLAKLNGDYVALLRRARTWKG